MKNNFVKSLKKLLTMRENTVGVYFTDSAIYLSLLLNNEKADFLEYKIGQGLIENGIIKNSKELSLELKKAIKKIGRNITFANITIQSDLIFSNIIHTPSLITEKEKLDMAVDMLLNVELPWKKDAAYTDYVLINENKESTCVSIFSAKKELVDSYISLFDNTEIKVLLVEFDSLSILRAISQSNDYTISVVATKEKANIIISRDNRVYFTLPIKNFNDSDKDKINKQIINIQNYFKAETGLDASINTGLILSEQAITFLKENITNTNLFPSLGASMRLSAFKDEDSDISFIDTKPNNLYRHHRILSSLQLVKKSTITVCLIIISVHILFFSIISNIISQKSIFSSQPPKIYSSVSSIKSEAKQLNEIINVGSQITPQIGKFSSKLQKIDNIFTEGIYPNSIVVSNSRSPININGIAATRSQYNDFRTSISKMSEVKIISFPLGNLSLQANIPFNITISVIE